MKNIIYCVLAIALISLSSCKDNREDGMSPAYVYLMNNGIQEQTVSADATEITVQLWATKSGLTYSPCIITYKADEDYLNAYNDENYTEYKILPADCYNFPQAVFELGGDDINAKFKLTYNPQKIYAIQQANPNVIYALPVVVSATGALITENYDVSNKAILTFTISAQTSRSED